MTAEAVQGARGQLLIPLAVVVSLVAGAWRMGGALTRIESRLDSFEQTVERVLERLDDAASDRWRKASMEHWVGELERLNPEITVPSVQSR